MSKTSLSSVQANILQSSDNINLAILERLMALEKQISESGARKTTRKTTKKAAKTESDSENAGSATASSAKPSKKQLQSINTSQFCIFDSAQISDYTEDSENLIWFSYIPESMIPVAESSSSASSRNRQCPIIQINRQKFIESIEKLSKKNRIFTISGKEYEMVSGYHCDSTVDSDVWTIVPSENDSN
jgi:hypothetical protein